MAAAATSGADAGTSIATPTGCCIGSERRAMAVLLVLAGFLLVALALVNDAANDDHMAVVARLRSEPAWPVLRSCLQCYHPKLYHLIVATALDLLPQRVAAIPGVAVRIGQMVSAIAMLGTLLLVRRLVSELPVSPRARIAAFALIATSPCLIGIGGQATNDSLVTFLSTAAIFAMRRFLAQPRTRFLAVAVAGAVLASVTKASGLILSAVLVGALLVPGLRRGAGGDRHRWAGPLEAAAFLAVWIAIVPYWGQYVDTARAHGSPLEVVLPAAPWPSLLERTTYYRPGTISIVDTYFSFRLADMIRRPMITNTFWRAPYHRSSFWSQLYGRTYFLFFAAWPQPWQDQSRAVVELGRLILILGLLPTAIALTGIAGEMRAASRLVFRGIAPGDGRDLLLDAIGLAFVVALIAFTMRYRDFSTMKPIFLLPALLAAALWLAKGFDAVDRRLPPAARPALHAWLGLLVALEVGTLGLLIAKLALRMSAI